MGGTDDRTDAVVSTTSKTHGFTRWIAANIGTAVPASMAPITFGLAALSSTGNLNDGALMMTSMTVAQVLGAVPISAMGRRYSVAGYTRTLVVFRTLAFVGLGGAIAVAAPLSVLVAAASLAGLVNGAIFGQLRAVLNDLVAANKLPRALGIAATVNELVFVLGPLLASTVGRTSILAAVGVMALTSALPLITLPSIPHRMPAHDANNDHATMPWRAVSWLLAAGSASACVASVEIGAVALAVRYGLDPSTAFLFTVPLCVASVLGGAWISVHNRRLTRPHILAMMLMTAGASALVAWSGWLGAAIIGAVVIGLFLAPLGASFSLSLDDVLPPDRRAEGFAMLRTSKSIGIIVASSAIAFSSLAASFLVSAGLALLSVGVLARAARIG